MKNRLINTIQNKEAVIGIIGLGYVGLPLAKELLKANFNVLGFDVDQIKVNSINHGISYIKHIDNVFLKEFVKDKKTMSATVDFQRLIETDIILICVPTPLDEHYTPDLSYVFETTEMISKYLRKGQVIVLESTTYPGTTDEKMLPILERSGLILGEDFYLGYSPEREDPGRKDFTTGNTPKVVSGMTKDGLEVIDLFYSQIVKSVPVTSTRVAESSKILENTFRAVNIALVNELKKVFDKMDIDIWEVIEAAKTKPFGFMPFYPGPGLGGHCIPIDPFYLTWKAREYGIHTQFIELAGEVNNSMPEFVINKTIKAINSLKKSIVDSKILIIGVAYKPNIDDLRESPSLKIIELLGKEGANINYFDPYIPKIPKTRKYEFDLVSIDINDIEEDYYDAAIIVTDHSDVDYKKVLKISKSIIDTRNTIKKGNKPFFKA